MLVALLLATPNWLFKLPWLTQFNEKWCLHFNIEEFLCQELFYLQDFPQKQIQLHLNFHMHYSFQSETCPKILAHLCSSLPNSHLLSASGNLSVCLCDPVSLRLSECVTPTCLGWVHVWPPWHSQSFRGKKKQQLKKLYKATFCSGYNKQFRQNK